MKKSIALATFPINALMDAYNYDTEEECKELEEYFWITIKKRKIPRILPEI